MRARRAGTAAARIDGCVGRGDAWRAAAGPARLATAVSLPTARAARPGAQRRDTPAPRRSKTWKHACGGAEGAVEGGAPGRAISWVPTDRTGVAIAAAALRSDGPATTLARFGHHGRGKGTKNTPPPPRGWGPPSGP